MDRAAPERPHRRPVLRFALSATVLGAVVALRGVVVAQTVGGRVRAADAVVDGALAVLGLALLYALSYGFERAIGRAVAALGARGRLGAGLARGLHAALLTAVVLPLALTVFALHPPRIACTKTPRDARLDYEDVRLRTADGVDLAAWYVPSGDDAARPIALVVPGLGANKQSFLPAVRLLWGLGYGVLVFDPRAHGDSEGRQTSFGLRESADVEAAWAWIAARFPGRRAVAVGYSMGGAALLRATAARDLPFERIVLDSTYARADTVAREGTLAWAGPFAGPLWQGARLCVRLLGGFDPDGLRSDALIAEVARARPVLIVHGAEDRVIPASEARRLAAAAGPGAEVLILEGAGHVETVLFEAYRARLARFLGAEE